MSYKIQKELSELVQHNVISQEIAQKIETYYKSKLEGKPNKLFTVFGVLGSTLVGLGIILILAHNWDDFSRSVKTIFAFLPLIIGQLATGYSIIKKKGRAWKEASGTFLFFAVGAGISLISQIYNIPGNLSSFLLTWMLLCSPLIYLLRSKAVALLHIVFATYYAWEYGYSYLIAKTPWMYLLLLFLILPFYLKLLKDEALRNITSIFNWIIPLSLAITLGVFMEDHVELLFLAYIMMFGLFYNIGKIPLFENQRLRRNGFLVVGSLGTIIILIIASFRWFWEEMIKIKDLFYSQEFYIGLVLFALTMGVLMYGYSKKRIREFNLFSYVFIIFGIVFFIGRFSDIIPTIICNLLILILGLVAIRTGARKMHFGILNYGLFIITVLIASRFFDTDMTFVIRGLLFVIVGAGFFLTNYLMLKKQNQ